MQAPMTIKQYVSQMRKIPGGRFTMGRTHPIEDKHGLFTEEVPAHPVDISAFRMGTTLITVGMWREYVRQNRQLSMPSAPAWEWIDDHPMVNVSWKDIVGTDGYCAWASRVAGIQLSLPTEAQWEFVAKVGQDQKYPWGNVYDDSKIWCSVKLSRNSTNSVGRSKNVFMNEFGIEDITGNVYQWCLDGYQPYTKKYDRLGYVVAQKDPLGNGKEKCARGCSWDLQVSEYYRCAFRYWFGHEARNDGLGFRLVAPPK
jgi:sulfatase modifying factor 1